MEKGLPFESGTGLTNVTGKHVGQSIGEIIIQSGQSCVPAFSIPRARPLGRTARREVERNRRWSTENIDIIVGLRVAHYFEIDPDNLGRWPHALR